MTILREQYLIDVLSLAATLPLDEIAQYEAFSNGKFEHQDAAASMWLNSGLKWTIADELGPLVAFGGYRMNSNTLRTWYLPSPRVWTGECVRGVTKITRNIIRDALAQGAAQRIETLVLSSRSMARRWYASIGLVYESTLPRFGSNGEDAAMYVALREKL